VVHPWWAEGLLAGRDVATKIPGFTAGESDRLLRFPYRMRVAGVRDLQAPVKP
jgi:hypothetical protein